LCSVLGMLFTAVVDHDATMDGLGLPAVSRLLQGDPDCLLGDREEGAGGGLHCGVELPAGKLTSGRDSIKAMHT
jgi:hypothetical protein